MEKIGVFNKATKAKEEYAKSEIKEKVEIVLGEYAIETEFGEKTEFIDFLGDNLQVSVTKNGDNYSFIIDGWQILVNEKEIISMDKFQINIDKQYSNVESMKADLELIAGQLVKTEGYWDKQYGGSAYYDIVSETSLTVDECECIQLNNGLYAELHSINGAITVNQYGAYGDGEHDDAPAINKAFKSNYSNIEFESEEYKINKRLDITKSNKKIMGNNATIFYNDEFTFVDDFIIGIFNYDYVINNIEIQNLSLVNQNTTRTDEHLMLKIIRCRRC